MEIGEPTEEREIRPLTEPVPEALPEIEPVPIDEPSEPSSSPEHV